MSRLIIMFCIVGSFSILAKDIEVGQKANYFSWSPMQRVVGEVVAIFDDNTVEIHTSGVGRTVVSAKRVGFALPANECVDAICVGDKVKYGQLWSSSSADTVETIYDNGYLQLEDSLFYILKKINKVSRRLE